jgi:hypothetical protein
MTVRIADTDVAAFPTSSPRGNMTLLVAALHLLLPFRSIAMTLQRQRMFEDLGVLNLAENTNYSHFIAPTSSCATTLPSFCAAHLVGGRA